MDRRQPFSSPGRGGVVPEVDAENGRHGPGPEDPGQPLQFQCPPLVCRPSAVMDAY
jgi:hypothetical protein